MEIRIALALPRDGVSVPVVRHVTTKTMRLLGVDEECVTELEVALSEACANVLRHAQAEDDYEVKVCLDDDQCVIEVVDRGEGFDAVGRGLADAEHDAERGRGIQLMRALVDEVHFTSGASGGTTVSLTKALAFPGGSPTGSLRTSAPPDC